jgi:hypothetical protein
MNLSTIVEVKRPASPDEITQWRDGYAWLGGGTWLFSEPQWATDTLIDLDQFRWPSLRASSVGLEIAATGRIVELYRFEGPAEWTAAPLFRLCCDSLLGSFKIWNAVSRSRPRRSQNALPFASRVTHPSRALVRPGDWHAGPRKA